MLDSVNDFFVATMNHGALLWVTEVTACSLNNIACIRIGVATFWALESFCGGREFAAKSTFVALIDRGVGA